MPGARMVGVAQLVEHRLVVPVAAGSSPVVHPTEPLITTLVTGVSARQGQRDNRMSPDELTARMMPFASFSDSRLDRTSPVFDRTATS